MSESIQLDTLNLSFAVELIDPRLGRITVEQVHWSGLDDGAKVETAIAMEPCEMLKV